MPPISAAGFMDAQCAGARAAQAASGGRGPLKTIFAQETAEAAREQWAAVADALRERFPKLADLMDGSRRTCWCT